MVVQQDEIQDELAKTSIKPYPNVVATLQGSGKIVGMSLIPKGYFHDRWALLFLTINAFLVGLIAVITLLRLDSTKADSYITQYRSNLGVNAFQSGGGTVFFVFIAFSILVLVLSTILSMKVYDNHRQYAMGALGMCLMLLIMVLFVSNALLAQG